MTIGKLLVIPTIFLISWGSLATAQVATSSTQALQIAQINARSALGLANTHTSIVLDGAFTSTEGSRTQNGNAHLVVSADGGSSAGFARQLGPIQESRVINAGEPACTWTDSLSTTHKTSPANCLVPPWFFPWFLLFPAEEANSYGWVAAALTSDGTNDHIKYQYASPDMSPTLSAAAFGSVDLALEPNTHLPTCVTLTEHAETGPHAAVAVRILYSDYRIISGVNIPFHIQRYVNGSLTLDVSLQTASIQ